ncbi:MAG TPA: hypothetical protein VFA09_01775 [Ktedonobacteraceae bacterium]|jgi:hypothetical protein|nr:hypothetical protein [Ktedonobacteraceae bacterium]
MYLQRWYSGSLKGGWSISQAAHNQKGSRTRIMLAEKQGDVERVTAQFQSAQVKTTTSYFFDLLQAGYA